MIGCIREIREGDQFRLAFGDCWRVALGIKKTGNVTRIRVGCAEWVQLANETGCQFRPAK